VLWLLVLALVVAAWTVSDPRGALVGARFPLAAIAACVLAVPVLQGRRGRLSAVQAQAVHLSLAVLTPGLVFAWVLVARSDADGDSGGALGAAALLLSAVFGLPWVLPATLHVLLALPLLRAGRWRVIASAALLGALALCAGAFALRHPTAEGASRYPDAGPVSLAPTATPGRFAAHFAGATIRQRRHGDRCVTHLVVRGRHPSPYLAHACASPLVVRGEALDRPSSDPRPRYREMLFVVAEGRVISNRHSPRAMLFTAPLWEWVVATLLAVALALHTVRRARASVAAWRAMPARHAVASNGLATSPDGACVRLPHALADYAGPVVLLDAESRASPFRADEDRAARVVPGDLARWVRALDETESLATSFALAVMWLPSAPLLAAPFLGMLSPLP
jgi:hypothetical protein